MKADRGFTLIELMIAVAIIGILAAVAYPSYMDHLRKGRRAQAQEFMMDIANREGQYLVDSRKYGGCCGVASDLQLDVPVTVAPYYTITAVADNTAGQPPAFVVTADPYTTDQKKDKCGKMTINQRGEKKAGDGTQDIAGCW